METWWFDALNTVKTWGGGDLKNEKLDLKSCLTQVLCNINWLNVCPFCLKGDEIIPTQKLEQIEDTVFKPASCSHPFEERCKQLLKLTGDCHACQSIT